MIYAKDMLGGRKSAGALNLPGAKRGSALIMVMLVVAGITTIIFATQRIALVQFSQSVRQEDNLSATYAAKAGIEDGLARYRFERNSETGQDTKFRFNLTTGNYFNYNTQPSTHEIPVDADIVEGVDEDYDPEFQYYDLTMSYRTNAYGVDEDGNPIFNAPNNTDVLEKDESVTLSGFQPSTDPYYLRYAFRFNQTCADNNPNAFVALQQITTTSSSTTTSQTLAKLSSATNYVYDSATTATNLKINDTGSIVVSVRITAFFCNVEYAFSSTGDPDGTVPSENPEFEFDGLTSDIISTGYFGSAKRTLIAQVDRRTGDLIGIFDYVLYAGGSGGTIN